MSSSSSLSVPPPPPSCCRLCQPPCCQLTPLVPPAPVLQRLSLSLLAAVVHGCIDLRLLSCLCLSSDLCLAARPSCLVGCHISQSLGPSLSLRLHPAPRPPPFITPPPFGVPLLFGWLLHCPAPQPPSRCNSAWCLGLCFLLSVWRCLPPLPPPFPSCTTSPSPERERGLPEHCRFCCHHSAGPPLLLLSPRAPLCVSVASVGFPLTLPLPHAPVARAWPQEGSKSKWMMFVFWEHRWSWTKKPVVLASCDKINTQLT